jgi:hypothetical protein
MCTCTILLRIFPPSVMAKLFYALELTTSIDMALSLQNKIRGIIIFILTAVLSVLPELIPERWKILLENKLGNNYDLIWIILFASISIIVFILTFYDNNESNKEFHYNSVKIRGNKNKSNQKYNEKTKTNEIDIVGDENETSQE